MRNAPTARGPYLALGGGVAFALAVTVLIWALGPRLEAVTVLTDRGPPWYEGKLPEPTFWTRLSAWGLYLAHQTTLWGLIFWAQVRRPGYGGGLHRVNLLALGASAGFVLLHVAQSHLTYDGLAQDVSIGSSQGAVIAALVLAGLFALTLAVGRHLLPPHRSHGNDSAG